MQEEDEQTRRIYNNRDLTKKRDRKTERERGMKTVAVLRTPKNSCREAQKN